VTKKQRRPLPNYEALDVAVLAIVIASLFFGLAAFFTFIFR